MNAFHAWLRSRDGGRIVERCISSGDRRVDEEKTSFWEYLLRQEGLGSITLHALVEREDWAGLERKVKSLHRLHRAEQSRDRLYQRVRQVLHDADKTFGYQAGDKFSWYGAMPQDATPVGTYEELRAAGFDPVCPVLDSDSIRSAAAILQLAASFREQLVVYHGQDRRIPIQTLCAFIRNHFDIAQLYGDSRKTHAPNARPGFEEDERSTIERGNSRNLPNTANRYTSANALRSASNDWHSEETLKRLADVVAHQLEREKLFLLVCLLTYCGLTMAQAAKALGYAGPSGVAAPYRKAQILIKETTSLFNGMGEDDLNDDMFHHFLGLLLDKCKEDDCSRCA